MTIIATTISRFCTVHATDSLITKELPDGNYEIRSKCATKIIRVPAWRGMMSIFGTILLGEQLGETVDLRDKLRNWVRVYSDSSSPEDFAWKVTEALNRLEVTRSEGIGIHFTAYESYGDKRIPELFQITNFTDTSYSELNEKGVTFRRETYEQVRNEWEDTTSARSEHGLEEYRLRVHEWLTEVGIIIYNNGDPALFNMSLRDIQKMLNFAGDKKKLRPMNSPAELRRLTTWPIEQIANFQIRFFRDGQVIIGGDMHNLSVTPEGKYESDTGDGLVSDDI